LAASFFCLKINVACWQILLQKSVETGCEA
jgi:hypothetical protein